MFPRTFARIGFSVLATLVVLFSAVASGYTQSDTQANGQVFLPVIIQDQSAVASDEPQSDTPPKVKPTIVLVHGAWADGSSWNGVTYRLQADGYSVDVPPNPLRGLAADAAHLASFLNTVTGPIILVGHSYGGAVITNAAVGNANVKALVYIDAFVPDQGESLLQLASTPPPPGQANSCLGGDPATVFNFVPYPGAPQGDVDLYIKPALFPACFVNDLPTSQAAVLAAAQRPIAFSALLEPSRTPASACPGCI